MALAAWFLPDSRADRSRLMDPDGQLLVIVAVSTVTMGIVHRRVPGWLGIADGPGVLVLVVAALAGNR